MKLFKRTETVGIYMDKINTVQQVNINELSFDNPYIHSMKVARSSQSPKKGRSSFQSRGSTSKKPKVKIEAEDDLEENLLTVSNHRRSMTSQMSASSSRKKKKRNKRLNRYSNLTPKEQSQIYLMKNMVLYGVVLRKMRKELIIRTPCVFNNKTSYTYELMIKRVETK